LSALALRGPEPLRPAFARFSAAYRASGRFGECLDALKDDLADPVGDRVCVCGPG
jgi:tight adherence protein B